MTLDNQGASPKPATLELQSGAAVRSSDLVRRSHRPRFKLETTPASSLKRSGAINVRHCCHSLSCLANARPFVGDEAGHLAGSATGHTAALPLRRTQTGTCLKRVSASCLTMVESATDVRLRRTTQAQRPDARDATIATAMRPPGSLQRFVERSRYAEWASVGLTRSKHFETLWPWYVLFD